MITGVVQSKRCHFEAIAAKAPDLSKPKSRVKRFARYVQNDKVDVKTYFLPFVSDLLSGLATSGPLILAMDASQVGRNCLVLDNGDWFALKEIHLELKPSFLTRKAGDSIFIKVTFLTLLVCLGC